MTANVLKPANAGALSSEERDRISNLSKTLSLLVVLVTVGMLVLSFYEQKSFSALMGILLLCAGGNAAGAWAGFLYSTFGQETDRFKGPFGLLNAAFGGALITDISKGDKSAVLGFLKSTSDFCGFAGNSSPVVFALVFYTFGGFMLTYYSRLLLLNPAAQRQDNEMKQMEKAVKTLADVDPANVEPGGKPMLSLEEADAMKVVLNSDLKEGSETVEAYRAQGQAEYYNGNYREAKKHLNKALALNPSDSKTLIALAQVYFAGDDPVGAIPFLERAAKQPDVSPAVWKLLGYAYLWDEKKIDEAEKASGKYLMDHPDDNGARLNLACACGQRGPTDPANREKCLRLLAQVFENDPEERVTVRELMKPGGDFEEWTTDPDFLKLVNPKE